jgi:hypothetical protein
MEIKGKVIEKMDFETGISGTGKAYKKQYIVIETLETYPKKVNICFFGDKTDALSNVYTGAVVNVSINLESREWNGKWYTEVNGWKLSMEAGESPQMKQAAASADFVNNLAPEEPDFETAGDDMPF